MLAQVVLYDGFDLLDAVAPFEVLWAGAALGKADLRVEFAALGGPCGVPSGPSGVVIQATAAIDAEGADVLVLPGAAGAELEGTGPETVPAILGCALKTGLPETIGPAFGRPNAIIATVCGGSLLLAMAGLLENRRAVTHHLGMGVLAAAGAIATDARVVVDGNFVSGGGVTSGLDVGLYLVERVLGPKVAHAVERLFEFERRGTIWHDRGLTPVALS